MNWRRILPPTGAVAAFIILLILMARGCQAVFYMNMVHVESGQFSMGCDECQLHERPVHIIQLDGFWIDQYEVANDSYAEFLNAGLLEGWVDVVQIDSETGTSYTQVEIDGNRALYLYPSINWSQITFSNGIFEVVQGKNDYPVTVSWHGAKAYCSAFDKRLPTEAEWEYAAKGGHLSISNFGEYDSYKFSGSDNPDTVAWHRYNSLSSHPIGELNPNEIDIFDMSGNLREWVNDWYDPEYYSLNPTDNPEGPNQPVYIEELQKYAGKVMRGGSWKETTYPHYDNPEIESIIDKARVRVTKRDYG